MYCALVTRSWWAVPHSDLPALQAGSHLRDSTPANDGCSASASASPAMLVPSSRCGWSVMVASSDHGHRVTVRRARRHTSIPRSGHRRRRDHDPCRRRDARRGAHRTAGARRSRACLGIQRSRLKKGMGGPLRSAAPPACACVPTGAVVPTGVSAGGSHLSSCRGRSS